MFRPRGDFAARAVCVGFAHPRPCRVERRNTNLQRVFATWMVAPCPHCDRRTPPAYRASARPVEWPRRWRCRRCGLAWTFGGALLDVPPETSAPAITRAVRDDRLSTFVLVTFALVFAVSMGSALIALVPLCAMVVADAPTSGNVLLFVVVGSLSAIAGGFFFLVAAELVLASALPMMVRREGGRVRIRTAGSLRRRRGVVFEAEDLLGVRFETWQHGLKRAVVLHRAGPAFFLCDAAPEGLGALRADLERRIHPNPPVESAM